MVADIALRADAAGELTGGLPGDESRARSEVVKTNIPYLIIADLRARRYESAPRQQASIG